MPWNEDLTELNHLLANLYPVTEDSYRIVAAAGLPRQQIRFRSNALDTWHEILSFAETRGRVLQVVRAARRDDANNADLIHIENKFLASEGDLNKAEGRSDILNPQEAIGNIDFAIVTIREDENRAVLKRFPVEHIYRGKHRSYAISRVPLPDGSQYLVAIIRSIEQGEGHSQDVARDITEDLDPQWILLVGIAGGVPAAEFTLGDVVAATRLTDFSVKAALEGRQPQYAVTGGPMHKKVQDLLALLPAMEQELGEWNSEASIGMAKPKVALTARNFYGSDNWKAKTKTLLTRHFGRSASLRPPLATAGTVASSDTLMKDTQTLQLWQEAARQLIAVEMELGGVYIAARRAEKEYPILAIRGISDIVGFKRHPDWTEYACQTAAAFVFALIQSKPIPPN